MTYLDYINQNYPIRRSKAEKSSFASYVIQEMDKKGIQAMVEESSDGKNKNIVIGDPESAEVVFTAHYDTPAKSLFPNIMIPKNRFVFYSYQFLPIILLLAVSLGLGYLLGLVWLDNMAAFIAIYFVLYYGMYLLIMRNGSNPYNYNDNTSGVATVLEIALGIDEADRNKAAFILFDNEEKGKRGSMAFFKDHKEMMKERAVINFDCVGNGENILFIAQRGALNSPILTKLKDAFKSNDAFCVDFCTFKEANANSDHKSFPCGVACVATKKSKNGLLYTPYIHTKRDIVSNNLNIVFLAKNCIDFIAKN